LKAARTLHGSNRNLQVPGTAAWEWIATLGAAGAVAIGYFLAARLGLALLLAGSDMPVFWPASGIAAGFLIATGPRARPALVIGVVVGNVAANLMSDRSILTSLFVGFCSAGEAVLAAWLLERRFGRAFTFGDLPRVIGFLVAAGLATAASAVGGAAIMTLLHTAASYWEVWRVWFLSGWVGIIVVAPLVIGLGQMWREPPSRGEWLEGLGVLAMLALAGLYAIGQPSESWLSFNPGIVVLPPLLWLAARCPPVFAIAGAFAASMMVICATIYGIGRFGDVAVPTMERVKAAQAVVGTGTIFTLFLLALFIQRKKAAEGLQHREAELAEAQRVARIGSWYWDAQTDVIIGSDELLRIYGFDPATRPADFRAQFDRHHAADDLERLKATARRTLETGVGFQLELRAFRNGTPIWVAARGEVVRNGAGQIVGLRGTAQDITERKRTEQTLSERNAQLALAAKAGLVGSYTYDVKTRMLQFSEGYAAIYDLPEGTREMTVGQQRALVHPKDLERLDSVLDQAFEQRRGEFSLEYRNILPKRGVRWIESRSSVLYDSNGRLERLGGVNIDITERKRAEEAQKLLNAELDHRVKNAIATVAAVVSHTQQGSGSVANFVTALEGRIRSMATTQELLSASRWQGISLTELVRCELAPYATSNNTKINGPDVILKPEAGQAVAMVLHELATNAAKYGALSTKEGRVSIQWDLRRNGHPTHLVLEWKEIGGPPVVAPDKSSFGMSTICDLIPYEFGGRVDLTLDLEGVRCRVELPAHWFSKDEPVSEATARASPRTADS